MFLINPNKNCKTSLPTYLFNRNCLSWLQSKRNSTSSGFYSQSMQPSCITRIAMFMTLGSVHLSRYHYIFLSHTSIGKSAEKIKPRNYQKSIQQMYHDIIFCAKACICQHGNITLAQHRISQRSYKPVSTVAKTYSAVSCSICLSNQAAKWTVYLP